VFAVECDQGVDGGARIDVQKAASSALCHAVGAAAAIVGAANYLQEFTVIAAAADVAGDWNL
jgi:hypothetical protein